MNPLPTGRPVLHRRRGRRPSRGALLLLALGLAVPALGWTAARLAVASLTLSPVDIPNGSSSKATVTLDARPTKSVTVQLTSSNTQVATVPSSVTFSSMQQSTSKTFTARSVSGASGCTRIGARLDTTPARQVMLFVHPPADNHPFFMSLSAQQVVGGGRLTATVLFDAPGGTLTGGTLVQLSSIAPNVAAVPASTNLRTDMDEVMGTVGKATFPITTSTVGLLTCSVITATYGNYTARALLKVTSIGG